MIQNINIARVSLITHGSLSALRTLGGVYIPRDRGVLGWAGYRRGGSERKERREGREGRSQAGSVCLCTFRGSRTAFGAVHCGILGPRIGAMEDACVRWRTRSLRWKNLPLRLLSLSSVPLWPWHNSSKILWLVDHWIWRYLARFSGSSMTTMESRKRRSFAKPGGSWISLSLSFFYGGKRKRERRETEGEVKNMIFSLFDVRRVSGISYGSRTMATLVRDARQNVFDDDEVGRAEQQKREYAGVQYSFASVFSEDYICYL